MTKSYYRGNSIIFDTNCEEWLYEKNSKPVKDNYISTPCGNCEKEYTKEGHDPCLGTLPGLMNACCGHGVIEDCYVQFLDGTSIHGSNAKKIQDILKECRE